MNINQQIRENLQRWQSEAIATFDAAPYPHPLFNEILAELKHIDSVSAKIAISKELEENCISYWTNVAEGINLDEKMDMLLFEHNDEGEDNPEAKAYGCVGADFKIKTIPYEYGYNYDFVKGLEYMPGITLSTLSPLARLEELKETDEIDDYDFEFWEEGSAFQTITAIFTFTSYIIVHDAITDFVKTAAFSKLSKMPVLHFHIGLHDSTSVPIYYFYETEDVLIDKIQEQGEAIDFV